MNTNVQPEQQLTSYRLQTVLNGKDAQANAEHIAISRETQTLIQCRARLSDIINDVTEVIEIYWGIEQSDKILEQFSNTVSDLDTALLGLLGDIMASMMLDENYKEM